MYIYLIMGIKVDPVLVLGGRQNLEPIFASFLEPLFIIISNPKCNICYRKLTKIWFLIAFVLVPADSFSVKQSQKWLV